MLQIKSFTFSPLQENTYVVSDETREAVIIDPGCLSFEEKNTLKDYISTHNLVLKAILLTHAHLDHVFGAAFLRRTFDIKIHMHPLEKPILADVENRCNLWGIKGYEPFEADIFFGGGESYLFGKTKLDIVHVPGHAPGHVAFIAKDASAIFGGDCLFYRSIGRTDFPFSSHSDLINSIKTQFFTLPSHYTVYAGHMQSTTIGEEKDHNPFFK
ncbi:MAG: MBL fold metallo-hydrolase [Leadbetterella sp.]